MSKRISTFNTVADRISRSRSKTQVNSALIHQNLNAIITKTGFLSTPAVTLSFVDGTRTFTVAPTGTNFNVWIQGVEFTKTAETIVITDTEGLWYIYYEGFGVLTASQTPWDNRDESKTSVAIIYWDATSNHHHYLGYEPHSFEITPVTHDYIHHVFGTMYASGLALVAGTGGDDGKIALDGGNIWDQDILIAITDGAGSGLFEQELGNTSVFAAAQIPVFYRSGASDWERYDAGDFPFYDNATVDNVHYNSYSAPNWASTAAATSAKYIAMWIMGTNNQTEPVIAIMGQIESANLNAAKDANTFESIDFGTLPFTEMKVLFRVIFKSDSTWAHTEDLRTLANVPGGTYVPLTHPISDDAFDSTWAGVDTIAPSKSAVYDEIVQGLDGAFDHVKEIDGANSEANGVVIGDGTDKIIIYTSGAQTYIKRISGNVIFFESDGTAVQLRVQEDGSNFFDFSWQKTPNAGQIFCTGVINAMGSGDSNDYWEFSSSGTYPRMKAIGGEAFFDTDGSVFTFAISGTPQWHIGSVTLYPESTNSEDIGSAARVVQDIFYHQLSDQTCADFSDYTLEDLIQKLTWQKRSDGILHRDKGDKYYPHIDFASIPDEFSYKLEEPIEVGQDNKHNKIYEDKLQYKMPKYDKKGKIEEVDVIYNIGDKIGIHFNTLVYALKDTILKLYDQIKILEKK